MIDEIRKAPYNMGSIRGLGRPVYGRRVAVARSQEWRDYVDPGSPSAVAGSKWDE